MVVVPGLKAIMPKILGVVVFLALRELILMIQCVGVPANKWQLRQVFIIIRAIASAPFTEENP
jgi:hypothetical protein